MVMWVKFCCCRNMLSSKRSASSASEADCYNMSLGAGPLWWSWCPWGYQGSVAIATNFPHCPSTMGRCFAGPHTLCGSASPRSAWGVPGGFRSTTWSGWRQTQMRTCDCCKYTDVRLHRCGAIFYKVKKTQQQIECRKQSKAKADKIF